MLKKDLIGDIINMIIKRGSLKTGTRADEQSHRKAAVKEVFRGSLNKGLLMLGFF